MRTTMVVCRGEAARWERYGHESESRRIHLDRNVAACGDHRMFAHVPSSIGGMQS